MFRYLLALLLAPLLRPIFNAVLLVVAVAFAVTIPARLWIMYVEPQPSYRMISGLNIATSAFLICVAVLWRVRRRRLIRRTYSRG